MTKLEKQLHALYCAIRNCFEDNKEQSKEGSTEKDNLHGNMDLVNDYLSIAVDLLDQNNPEKYFESLLDSIPEMKEYATQWVIKDWKKW